MTVFGLEQFISQMNTAANGTLHPHQAMISYGDCWVRFLDVSKRVVEFGRVATRDEVSKMLDLDDELNTAQRRQAAENLHDALINGYMYGVATSKYGQEWGITHKQHVWPIEESLYRAGLLVQCRIEHLELHDKINLEAAFRAQRGAKR